MIMSVRSIVRFKNIGLSKSGNTFKSFRLSIRVPDWKVYSIDLDFLARKNYFDLFNRGNYFVAFYSLFTFLDNFYLLYHNFLFFFCYTLLLFLRICIFICLFCLNLFKFISNFFKLLF